MELTYIVADPAGNTTGLVLSKVNKEKYGLIAQYLMAHAPFGLEQVGFVESCQDCDGALEMMGGEFCGNASRSFGLYLAQKHLSQKPDCVIIRVSGAGEKLEVETDVEQNEAKIKMPQQMTLKMEETESYGVIPLMIMEGICHALLLNQKPDEAKAKSLLAELIQRYDMNAFGIMYYDAGNNFLTPLVWVQATDTLIWESSCGSGSVALGSYLNQGEAQAWQITFNEPGGLLKVEKNSGGDLSLSGPVTFSEIVTVQVPFE